MITTLIISLREFLEVFIIAGIFLGVSRKLNLKKEKQIITAVVFGIITNFILITTLFFLKEKLTIMINHEAEEMIEGFLKIFSGLFIGLVVIILHRHLPYRKNDLEVNVQSLAIFSLVVFEGLEIALFSIVGSFNADFVSQIVGLFLGLLIASITAFISFFLYIKLPIPKIIKITEWGLIILALLMIKEGIWEFI